jgi:hypothetical protein
VLPLLLADVQLPKHVPLQGSYVWQVLDKIAALRCQAISSLAVE